MKKVIQVENLSLNLGFKKILKNISLSINSGSICALLGRNGVGKTTLIKTIMNIYSYSKGSSKVFGVESSKLSPTELTRIGYVAESQELPLWMTVSQFLKYCSTFYPNWDHTLCSKLINEMKLPRDTKLKALSKGMRAKVALISSLSYNPELLILDEPFGGLDPIVREEIISSIISLSQNQETTVFISSHDLEETEQISDSLAILQAGRILLDGQMDNILNRFRRVRLSQSDPQGFSKPSSNNWLNFKNTENVAEFIDSEFKEDNYQNYIREIYPKAEIVSIETISLKEIYKVILGNDQQE